MTKDSVEKKVKKEKKEKKEKREKKDKEEEEDKEVEVLEPVEEAAPRRRTRSNSDLLEVEEVKGGEAKSASRKRKSSADLGAEEGSKKAKVTIAAKHDDEEKTLAVAVVDKNAPDKDGNPPFSSFPLDQSTLKALWGKGYTHSFPIQTQTFYPIYEGKDIIGRARTGQGKTLAFALPVIALIHKKGVPSARGRLPCVLVLSPTRELTKQIADEFTAMAPNLAHITVYGGTSYDPQTNALRRGVDIVVGTPGRVCDHIDRSNLKLTELKYLILDEADRMLDMGFETEMNKVFDSISSIGKFDSLQTLLFSATIPPWVKDVTKKYMKPDHVMIDLVEKGSNQTSKDVTHLCVKCPWQVRQQVTGDLIQMYGGSNGRTIVFCETKKDCNDLSTSGCVKQECRVLHGDIPQATREITLKQFVEGKFKVLIATDVAARGLHIDDVDLVIQSEPPAGNSGRADTDTYVHRSGRTGRAGRKGTAITVFTAKQEYLIGAIEQKIGHTIQRIGAPQPSDIVKGVAKNMGDVLAGVHDTAVSLFVDAAKELIDQYGEVEALARALACASGYTAAAITRSLLSGSEGFCTMQFSAHSEVRSPSFIWAALKKIFDEELTESIRGMTLTKDRLGAVFDVPDKYVQKFKDAISAHEGTAFSVCSAIPELEESKAPSFNSFGGGNFGRGNAQRGGGGGGYGGRGGGFGGRGGGRGGGGRGGGGGYGGRGGGGFRGGRNSY